jgi:hypothetical protein
MGNDVFFRGEIMRMMGTITAYWNGTNYKQPLF